MSGKKTILAITVSALVISGILTVSASAHKFLVEGKEIAAGESVPITYENSGTLVMQAAGLRKECKQVGGHGELKAEGKAIGTITASECTVVEPAHCSVKEPIEISGEGELVTYEGKLAARFGPVGGGELLFTLDLLNSGGTCSLEGLLSVAGKAQGFVNNELEEIEHTLTFNATSGSEIMIGGSAVVMKVKMKGRLGGAYEGEHWSAK